MTDQLEGDVLEFDLDEDSGATPGRTATKRLGALWPHAAWGLVGVLVGGLAVHVVQEQSATREATAVRVALGEFGARQLTRRIGTTRAVLLSTVAVNESGHELVITGLRAEGAQVRPSVTYSSMFPLRLEPGETAEMPIVLRGDCAVRPARTPRITMLVGPPGRQARPVDVDIPDLESVWSATLAPEACDVGA